MTFNYPKPCNLDTFDNDDIASLFDSWIENLPPGTYLTNSLRNYFNEEVAKRGMIPRYSDKSFTQHLNAKGLKMQRFFKGRCHIKT